MLLNVANMKAFRAGPRSVEAGLFTEQDHTKASLFYGDGRVELEVNDITSIGCQGPEKGLPSVSLEQGVLAVCPEGGGQLGCRVHVCTSQTMLAKVTVL